MWSRVFCCPRVRGRMEKFKLENLSGFNAANDIMENPDLPLYKSDYGSGNGGGPPNYGERFVALEKDVEHIKENIREIRTDIKEIRNDINGVITKLSVVIVVVAALCTFFNYIERDRPKNNPQQVPVYIERSPY